MDQYSNAALRPPLFLVDTEADTLSHLAWSHRDRRPDICTMLLHEIDRANLCEREGLPNDVVAMACQVDYVDERAGQERTVELVYPNHADASLGRISIMTLVGAGLIGLAAGSSIIWPDREGKSRRLTVNAVRQKRQN